MEVSRRSLVFHERGDSSRNRDAVESCKAVEDWFVDSWARVPKAEASGTVVSTGLSAKPVVAMIDQRDASSDGGVILLKAAEARYGPIEDFARWLA